jgi:hypothetical protein
MRNYFTDVYNFDDYQFVYSLIFPSSASHKGVSLELSLLDPLN